MQMAAHARSKLVAGFLGFVTPGLGHLYVGRPARFAPAVLLLFAVVAALAAFGGFPTFHGMALYVLTLLVIVAFSTIDPLLQAQPRTDFVPRWYNRWYVYLGWLVLVVAVLNFPRLIRESVLGFSAFRVPGVAMQPTIKPRDMILVDTRAYRSRLPDVKDVVVVHNPANGLMYVRRVSRLDTATISLASDNPAAADNDSQLAAMPLSNLLGKVTYVMYSQDFGRIGQKIE
jgi:hypothetical protein